MVLVVALGWSPLRHCKNLFFLLVNIVPAILLILTYYLQLYIRDLLLDNQKLGGFNKSKIDIALCPFGKPE